MVSVSPQWPHEIGLFTLAPPVLQGTVDPVERISQHLPDPPLQGTELATLRTPEVSFERLIPLAERLAAWKLLPNVSQWVLHTVEKGYRIQFGSPPPPFNGVLPTLVGPKQALVIKQEVNALLRKEAIEVVPEEASLTGWGAIMSGGPAHGLWSGCHLTWHINCLEMLAVFQVLKYFLPDLRGHHVLVRTDNTVVVSYINHQSSSYSWASQSGTRRPAGEWASAPEVVELIWSQFGQAQVDLFATQETSQCPLWFSLSHPAPLGLDAMVQTWARLRLYAFPLIALLPGVLERVCWDGISLLLVAPFRPGRV
ncbi:ORF V: Enzymatic polyprotein [Labeo rohita]|uniref:ORF V: Enzymatic polyprotein n=1 Tax=Labeo rohita TaxID=84645 RepID=A0ABQ8LHK3_LABRO|nr:ORF V: Enzymatic polyprotein [Labeo rohita]